VRVRGRGESYGAPPLPTLLLRCLNVESEIDYDDLVLLTASTVIVYVR
jgi:hypothetical protein